jgi:hypothetical protein
MDVALQDASTIIVTFGTAWVYEYQGQVVANCHKLPAKEFVRRRLTVEEIVSQWQSIIERMPNKHWIFTVSPIRHVKDGLHENQLSKAILLQAIDELLSRFSSSIYCLDYFPSYEIVMDELRDYRFYERDMLHPNPIAIDIIWDRFLETYSNTNVREVCMLVDKYRKMKQHKPFFPDREEYKQHQSKMEILSKRLEDMLGRVLQ